MNTDSGDLGTGSIEPNRLSALLAQYFLGCSNSTPKIYDERVCIVLPCQLANAPKSSRLEIRSADLTHIGKVGSGFLDCVELSWIDCHDTSPAIRDATTGLHPAPKW